MAGDHEGLVYNHEASLAVGVAELVLGVFSATMGIQAFYVYVSYGYLFYGLWCGGIVSIPWGFRAAVRW